MRLTGFAFVGATDSPITAGYLPLDDLTVLIGPNDSGKSSTLGLLARALLATTPEGWRPSDFEALPSAETSVVYAQATAGDRDFLLAAVADPHHDPAPDEAAAPPDASAEPVESYMWPRAELRGAADLCEMELADRFGDDDGALLMAALRATNVFAFELTDDVGPGHHWTVHWCLPRDHSLAAIALRGSADEAYVTDDGPIPLWTMGPARLQILPRPVMAPVGMDTPRAELEEYVGRVATHIRMTEDSDDIYDDAFAGGYDDRDSWIVGARGGLEVKVDPLVEAIVKSAEAAAAGRMPAFVRDTYDLRLRIRPVLEWSRGRIAIELEPTDRREKAFPAARAAAGLRTWVEIALLEAVSTLAAWSAVGHYLFFSTDHEWDLEDVAPPAEVVRVTELLRSDVVLHDAQILARERARADALATWAFANLRRHSHADLGQVATTLRRYVYLIDEPERHLQPGLQRLAARWLEDTFRELDSQAIVATHAPAFLTASTEPHVVRVSRTRPTRPLQSIDVAGIKAADALAREMGFDRGELLAGITAVLYVEGAVDREVLDALLGEELRAARIVLSAFGGTYNITELLHDPLLTHTTARVAVLVDNLGEERIRKLQDDPEYRQRSADRGRNEGDWIARLLIAAERAGRLIAPFGLVERDVFFLLDDHGLRAVSDLWPGHAEAWERWERHRQASRPRSNQWKDFFADEFAVPVNSATARKAGGHMKDRDAVPDELRDLVFKIESLGLESFGS